jgi:CheY-like chemotaxis protein
MIPAGVYPLPGWFETAGFSAILAGFQRGEEGTLRLTEESMSMSLPSGPTGPGSSPRRTQQRWVSFDEAKARLSGRTAVVIDADTESSGRIFVSLGTAGAKVRIARRVLQGLTLVSEVQPDFVLLGTHLPDGDSAQLVARLKAGDGPRPIVVALAPGPSRAIRRRFLAAGADVFLCKPIDVHLFAQQLAREL